MTPEEPGICELQLQRKTINQEYKSKQARISDTSVLTTGWLCHPYARHVATVNPTPHDSLSLRCWMGKCLSLLRAMHGSLEMDLSTCRAQPKPKELQDHRMLWVGRDL